MANSPAESRADARSRIRTSMEKWRRLDEPAKRLGRGLGRKELLDRVAQDVGLSLRQVSTALRAA